MHLRFTDCSRPKIVHTIIFRVNQSGRLEFMARSDVQLSERLSPLQKFDNFDHKDEPSFRLWKNVHRLNGGTIEDLPKTPQHHNAVMIEGFHWFLN